ncbi:MAG: flavodoxin family protein [Oscillospiraceae bacterium]|nr:flavodoxin family protein [Oscillospiraceae bacterium]
MKIAILNGSPRKENTAAMVEAFRKGAKAAGHEVEVYQVGKMKIAGCLGCEYCHTKGNGTCVQKDDLKKIMPAYTEADLIVFASPIYYFTMTAQMQAALQRVYCVGKPAASKAVLMLSSGSDEVFDAAITQFKDYMDFAEIEIAGILTSYGEENKSEEKLNEIREFAASL